MKLNMLGPDPTSCARPLQSSGPPFPARAPSAVTPPQPGVAGIDPEEADSSFDEDDDDGDEQMAEGVAEESSSEEDDDEENDDGAE